MVANPNDIAASHSFGIPAFSHPSVLVSTYSAYAVSKGQQDDAHPVREPSPTGDGGAMAKLARIVANFQADG